MSKVYLNAPLLHSTMVAGVIALVLITSGCFPITNAYKSTHMGEASLEWYTYWSAKDSGTSRLKAEYEKKIADYLAAHPQTSKEIADKMRNCKVTVGMTEEQVLAMVKPSYILKGRRKKEKIFKYSDLGKLEWIKLIGEGTKVWVTLTNGVVTDIREVDLVIGY